MAPPRRMPAKARGATGSSTAAQKSASELPENRFLPTKEAALFKLVLQQYEQKQWKNGVKSADQILAKYPDHGETLAMKGLFLTCLDQKETGYELVRKGVKNDMQSHIVWHVYGLLHRADKNYEEALKCYSQANRIEKDSLNILNDLATLSIQLRNHAQHVEARVNILRVAPRFRRHWVGLAVAYFAASMYFEADRVLTNYEDMLREVPDDEFDHSEILLFHALVLERAGKLDHALDFLGANAGKIVDRAAYSVQRARILLQLGRTEPAEWAYDILLEENPDSYDNIKAAVKAKGADMDAPTEEGRSKALGVLDKLSEKFPRSLSIRRLALDIASGPEFKARATKYITDALSKGVPSIFADIKALYRDKHKQEIIGQLAQELVDSLKADSRFAADSVHADQTEAPSTLLWTLYFLAAHHSQAGKQEEALAVIEEAIAHTPSLPELFTLKARILKRAGDIYAAVDAMADARALDGQDRFLNSKHAKYLIRAGRVAEAEEVAGLFTKADAASPLDDLVDMQCLWFLQEEGDQLAASGQSALALKRYQQIFAIFKEVNDDEWDFHSYCLRKSTLRAYAELISFEDTLRSHPRYIAAASGAVQIYLRLHDDPSTATVSDEAVAASEDAKKKAEAARQKQIEEIKTKRAEKAAEAKKTATKKSKDKGKDAKKEAEEEEDEDVNLAAIDSDPHGIELLRTKTPLDEAAKWIKPLETAAPRSVETWRLSFELATRRKKLLLALKALRNLAAIDPSRVAVHPLLIRFLASKSSWPAELVPTIEQSLKEVAGEKDLDASALTAALLQSKPQTTAHVLAAAEGHIALGQLSEAESLLFQLVHGEAARSLAISAKDALTGLRLLESAKSGRIDEYTEKAHETFPRATAFKSSAQLEAEETARKVGTEEEVDE